MRLAEHCKNNAPVCSGNKCRRAMPTSIQEIRTIRGSEGTPWHTPNDLPFVWGQLESLHCL